MIISPAHDNHKVHDVPRVPAISLDKTGATPQFITNFQYFINIRKVKALDLKKKIFLVK